MKHFRKKYQVMFVMDPIEKTNTFYTYTKSGMTLEESEGYFIYYDKNESMHEYMVHNKMSDNPENPLMVTSETLPPDHASVLDSSRARSLTKAYTKEARDNKRVVNLLVGLCAVLFIVSFIVGAGLIQTQDSISDIKRQLSQLSISYTNLAMQMNRDNNAEAVFAGEDESSMNNGLEDVSQEERTMSLQPTDTDTPTTEPSPTLPLEPLPERYTVQDGDTLNSIAMRFYGTSDMVSRIMEYNGITDPNVIVSGRTLELPSD